MATLARWCFRHRVVVVLLWAVALAGLGVTALSVGSAYSTSVTVSGTESTTANELLAKGFPGGGGETDTVVWHVTKGTVRDAAVQQRMTTTLAAIDKLPHVESVDSPYTAEFKRQIDAKNGTTAYARVHFDQDSQVLPKTAVQGVIDTATAARTNGLEVEVGGKAVGDSLRKSPQIATFVGLAAAAVVLLVAFGSLLAMLLPLATALVALGTALSGIILLSHAFGIANFAGNLAALIGLGVGVDYALFIITRHRAGLKAGDSPEDAAVTALNTSGRAVLFAGGTVCIALLGIFILNLSLLNGVAVAAVLTVLLTMAAATTLLPALLGFLGHRVLSRRERRRLADGVYERETAPGYWARWAGFVSRHPRMLSTLAVALMLVLAIPFTSLRLGSSDQGNDPATSTTRKAYDLLADSFGPGFNGPLQLAAQVSGTKDKAALDALVKTLDTTPGVESATPARMDKTGSVGRVEVIPTTRPQDVETSQLVRQIRDDLIPAAEKGSTLQVYVGGQTAQSDDFADVVGGKLWYFVGIIVALGCVLLLIAFRSVFIPLTAAVMNLLAAAASFGVMVAVFQLGWGSELLGAGRAGPIEAFVPVMLLAILFGLSMDYQVFLVSRMHEEWLRTGDNDQAVSVGVADTSRVITAAATIMIVVFASFALMGQRVIAEFGIGLASAVLLDAFVLRTMLVPAVMHLAGGMNWWLPRLRRPAAVPVPVGAPGAAPAPAFAARFRPRRLAVLGVTVLVLVAVGGGINAAARGRVADECSGAGERLDVVVTPELGDAVKTAAEQLSGGGCPQITVTARSSADEATALAAGGDKPDVWIPDSSVWPQRVDEKGVKLPLRNQSVTQTPVVFGVQKSVAEKLGWPEKQVGVTTLLTSAGTLGVHLGLADPAQSAGALAAVLMVQDSLSGRADAEERLTTLVRGANPDVPTDSEGMLAKVAGDKTLVAPVSEQAVAVHNTDAGATDIVAVYPHERAMVLDYPFVTVTGDSATQHTADQLLNELRGSAGQAMQRDDGFRTGDGALGPLFTPQRGGVDPEASARLYVPMAEEVSAAEQTLAALRKDSQVLAALDVSASMSGTVAGTGRTRLDLLKEAAAFGLAYFPVTSNIGLWEFATNLGGGKDYQELVPIGPLGARANGMNGNQQLVQAITGLRPVSGGGTGLYDTVLAATRAARAVYDPKRNNAVVLITDGRNDDPGGMALSTLVAKLKTESRGGKPIPVITLAYGPDSDTAALQQISTATGGKMYPSLDPANIGNVFLDAIGRRACQPPSC